MQKIDMSAEAPMEDAAKVPPVKYSAAYSTGRELMLEPRCGCAGEALLRREASPTASPMVWPDNRSLRGAKSLEACPQGAARECIVNSRVGVEVP